MSSPQPSSSTITTQGSDLLSTHTPSNDDNDVVDDNFHSYRDLSGSTIFAQIQKLQSEGIHYAAKENITSLCEFVFNKDVKGDILIPKIANNKISEFILTDVFQIDARNFFMTSDGKWNSNNPLSTRFDQVKPSCYLLPVQRDTDFSFSANDFPTIVSNLRAIENLSNPRKSRDTHSVIVEDSNQSTAIKLTHHLFVVCHPSFHRFSINIFFIKEKKPRSNTNIDHDGMTPHNNNSYILITYYIY